MTRTTAGASPTSVLTARALNRATLHRQLLLWRSPLPVYAAVERLAGLQAQETVPPYVGLWSRLVDFERDSLTQLMLDRRVVRAWTMRYTLHLLTADDFCYLRPLLQPVLERAQRSFCGKGTAGMDLSEISAFGRELLEQRPRTTVELRKLVAERWPDRDPASLAHTVLYLLPVVHTAPGGTWGIGRSVPSALGERWLGRSLAQRPAADELVRRYLAAFGPASVMDVQAWCGMTRLRETVDRMRPSLVVFRDEAGKELFDLPDAPRPDPETPAPVRLLPDFDNLMVGYADRSRMMTDVHRRLICKGAGVVRASVLVDGVVHGAWRLRRRGTQAVLSIEAFTKISRKDRLALDEEAIRLLSFLAPEASAHAVELG